MKLATLISLKSKLKIFLDILLLFIGIISLVTFLLLIGFLLTRLESLLIQSIIHYVVYIFIFEEVLRFLIARNYIRYIVERWLELTLTLLLSIGLILSATTQTTIQHYFPFLKIEELTLAYIIISQMLILISATFKIIRHSDVITRIRLHPGAIFAISFATIILIGSMLLMLPNATPIDKPIGYINALFTSTSAVCVTGLIVVDTAKDFTFFGQIIILLLIQVGGLGVMTLTSFFATFLAGGLSLRMRMMMKEFLSYDNISAIGSLLVKIALYTFIIESIGVVFLYISLKGITPTIDSEALFVSVFHSISAFCNAGFSIFSENLMAPMVANNYWFKFIITILLIVGGLGFLVLVELSSLKLFGEKARKIKHQLSVSSKLALVTSLVLIIWGTILIFFGELNSNVIGLGFLERIFNAYFQSASARTCGFNTVDIAHLTTFSALTLILLMWIGASPGGTGGGIKTTTFAIAIIFLFNYIRGKEKVELFNRQIAEETIKRALTIIFVSVGFLCLSSAILILLEQDKNPLNLLFESASALGTVGLSRNVTFNIGDGAKITLILTMFIGRIGVLTFLMAFFKPIKEPHYSLPMSIVNVG